MILDALLSLAATVAGWIADLLPTGHLSLPSLAGLSTVLGQLDSLLPITGPLAAALVVLACVGVFITVRLILTLWNLIWP